MNKTINYKNLEWYIIKETNKEKLLLLKECMSKELIGKYFTDKSMIDSYYDGRFNINSKNIWWEDSYIREVLNGPFLDDLNKDELNIMRTTLKSKNEEKTTEDYVRLLTVEEVKNLSKEILKVNRKCGYWTMSPCSFIGDYASVFGVYSSGSLNNIIVSSGYGIRPVVSLKSNNFKIATDERNMKLLEEMRRVIKL